MRYDKLVILGLLLIVTACSRTPEQQIDMVVRDFAEALYNLDYEKAQGLCTPQSALIISLLASNISSKNFEQIKKAGRAKVEISSISINDGRTEATVKCKISNYLKLDIFNDNSFIEKEAEETFYLVKDENNQKWLVELHI